MGVAGLWYLATAIWFACTSLLPTLLTTLIVLTRIVRTEEHTGTGTGTRTRTHSTPTHSPTCAHSHPPTATMGVAGLWYLATAIWLLCTSPLPTPLTTLIVFSRLASSAMNIGALVYYGSVWFPVGVSTAVVFFTTSVFGTEAPKPEHTVFVTDIEYLSQQSIFLVGGGTMGFTASLQAIAVFAGVAAYFFYMIFRESHSGKIIVPTVWAITNPNMAEFGGDEESDEEDQSGHKKGRSDQFNYESVSLTAGP